MSTRAVIYVRVSTDDQARDGLSLDAQEDECRRYAEGRGWVVSGVHREEGLSGSTPLDQRPALLGAVAQIGKGDRIVALRRERVFRADPYEIGVIERAVAAKGGRIISTRGEGTETDSSADVVVRRIMDGVAEGERIRIGERTREALGLKRRRSERCGQVPYGYRLAADGVHVEPDPGDAGLVDLVSSLRADGLSLRKIGAELLARGYRPKNGGDGWGDSTIRRILARAEPCPET